MPSRISQIAPIALLVMAAACAPSAEEPPITRALLPPAPVAPTTTSTTVIDELQADQTAQADLLLVLDAARKAHTAEGSFDQTPAVVDALVPSVTVVPLQEAALGDGVVYDPGGVRATLYAESLSGTWFCVGLSSAGDDFGFGDSFEEALSACTDGALGTDWGNPFSSTGPDESAIEAAFQALSTALVDGDREGAASVFGGEVACAPDALAELWPAGLALIEAEDLTLTSIAIAGDSGSVEARLGSLDTTMWPVGRVGGSWLIQADPCTIFERPTTERMEVGATELLEVALFTVREAFVEQEDFGFGSATLADLDGDLQFVSVGEVGFGTLFYSGSPTAGVVVTGGPPGLFYCAVESLAAATVYGRGITAEEIRTPGRCRARTVG